MLKKKCNIVCAPNWSLADGTSADRWGEKEAQAHWSFNWKKKRNCAKSRLCARLFFFKQQIKNKTALAVESVENPPPKNHSRSGSKLKVKWTRRVLRGFPGSKPLAMSGMFYANVNQWRQMVLLCPPGWRSHEKLNDDREEYYWNSLD